MMINEGEHSSQKKPHRLTKYYLEEISSDIVKLIDSINEPITQLPAGAAQNALIKSAKQLTQALNNIKDARKALAKELFDGPDTKS